MRGTCSNPASFNPVKLFRPSVYTVEPGTTFCLRKANRVEPLKSGMTAIRARPVPRPRFSTATRTSDAVRIEDKRSHRASDRQPSTAGKLPLWRTSPEIPVRSSEMPDEARAYTTARGLLRQPDKQKLANLGGEFLGAP